MDINQMLGSVAFVFGVLMLIGIANLMDFTLQTMAQNKAEAAEAERFRKWGLPPAPRKRA